MHRMSPHPTYNLEELVLSEVHLRILLEECITLSFEDRQKRHGQLQGPPACNMP